MRSTKQPTPLSIQSNSWYLYCSKRQATLRRFPTKRIDRRIILLLKISLKMQQRRRATRCDKNLQTPSGWAGLLLAITPFIQASMLSLSLTPGCALLLRGPAPLTTLPAQQCSKPGCDLSHLWPPAMGAPRLISPPIILWLQHTILRQTNIAQRRRHEQYHTTCHPSNKLRGLTYKFRHIPKHTE